MVEYKILYSKLALKDAKKLICIIKNNPFQKPLPSEKSIGNLDVSYSRRISRMWSHYSE